MITIDTTVWECLRRVTSGAGPEFTDSHAAVIAGTDLLTGGKPIWQERFAYWPHAVGLLFRAE